MLVHVSADVMARTPDPFIYSSSVVHKDRTRAYR